MGTQCSPSNHNQQSVLLLLAQEVRILPLREATRFLGKQAIVFKIQTNSERENVLKELQRTKKKFIDSQFVPNQLSLGQLPALCSPKWKKFTPSPQNVQEQRDIFFLIQILLSQFPRLRQLIQGGEERGLWNFRLMNEGVFQQVIVDQYIPYDKDRPYLTNSNDLFFVLLVKALAKLKGTYQKLLHSQLTTVLQHVLLCPFSSFKAPELSAIELSQRLLKKGQFTVQIAISSIFQRTLFFLLYSFHQLTTNLIAELRPSPTLLKLFCPTQKVLWDGAFSPKDPVWYRINQKTRRQLLSISYKSSRIQDSFFMEVKEFRTFFQTVYQFHSFQSPCLNFLQLHFPKPAFFRVTLKVERSSRNYLALHQCPNFYNFSMDNTIFLIAKRKTQKLTYFPAINLRTGRNKVLFTQFEPGQYQLIVGANFSDQNSSRKINVQVFSQTFPFFINTNLQSIQEISQIILNHARYHVDTSCGKMIFKQNPEDWIVYKDLFNELGLGYIALSLSKNSERVVRITLNKLQIQKEGFKLLSQQGEFTLSGGRTLVAIFVLKDDVGISQRSFPPKVLLDQLT